MLSVQNSEAWALSQANPKTEPISPQTEPVFREVFQTQRRFFPTDGACFSQRRSLFFQKRSFPKTVTDFPKIGDGFPQNRWRISPKSATHFPKSVTHFPKVGDGFPQNRWLISWEPSLVSRNPNSQSQKIPNAFLSMYILAQNTKTMRDFQPATTRGACRKTQTRVNLWISCVSTLKCICKHGMLPCASGIDVQFQAFGSAFADEFRGNSPCRAAQS